MTLSASWGHRETDNQTPGASWRKCVTPPQSNLNPTTNLQEIRWSKSHVSTTSQGYNQQNPWKALKETDKWPAIFKGEKKMERKPLLRDPGDMSTYCHVRTFLDPGSNKLFFKNHIYKIIRNLNTDAGYWKSNEYFILRNCCSFL